MTYFKFTTTEKAKECLDTIEFTLNDFCKFNSVSFSIKNNINEAESFAALALDDNVQERHDSILRQSLKEFNVASNRVLSHAGRAVVNSFISKQQDAIYRILNVDAKETGVKYIDLDAIYDGCIDISYGVALKTYPEISAAMPSQYKDYLLLRHSIWSKGIGVYGDYKELKSKKVLLLLYLMPTRGTEITY